MLYAQREKLGWLSVALGKHFARLGLTPNQWTLLGLLLTIVAAGWIIAGWFAVAALFVALAAFFDLVDGSVARQQGMATTWGAYLDTVVDRYAEGILVVALLFVAAPALFLPFQVWAGVYLVGSFMTTYVKAAAKEKELVKQDIKGGLFERAERMILLVIGLVLAPVTLSALSVVVVILGVVSNISALQRITIVASHAKAAGRRQK